MINDTLERFQDERSRLLQVRFTGQYRALVVETNDPLNMRRVRFKCPELHDFSLIPDECPWAIPAFDLGGERTGRWSHPCIGDYIWISFEKNHPYGPIWTGFATPTRRKFYTYPQISNISPTSVNIDGKVDAKPIDYDINYLPKDGRPMSHGWADRYGSIDIHSSVGFFPTSHKNPPPPPGYDAIQAANYKAQQRAPEVNSPDLKYMARITKYGHMLLMGDQGYNWKEEFSGNTAADEKFETDRWLYIQKLLNEGKPGVGVAVARAVGDSPGYDQRRQESKTRYGHKFEMRDVGWAQAGPTPSKSRPGEFGPAKQLSLEDKADERWIKIRTKAGMLFQASDIGANPADDNYIKRLLIDECGVKSEQENIYWKDKDARWIRIVTRWGIKFVLDDRGSSKIQAEKDEAPYANGALLKGRRSPSSKAQAAVGTLKGDEQETNPKGFYFEFNENDQANHSSWGSPLGQSIELNDRYQYIMLVSSKGPKWAATWQGIKENEFIRKPLMLDAAAAAVGDLSAEQSTHHLKLDHDNEYIRFKTRGGKGVGPDRPITQSGADTNQGWEARDGSNGLGPWVEMVDCQNRGMWFSKTQNLGIWRAKQNNQMYTWMDDNNNLIVVYNNQSNGKIQIYANGNVDIISKQDININSGQTINMRAETIKMQAGGLKLTLNNDISTNGIINAERINAFLCGAAPGDGAGCPTPSGDVVTPVIPPNPPLIIEPNDRGKTYNGPFEACPIAEVEHSR